MRLGAGCRNGTCWCRESGCNNGVLKDVPIRPVVGGGVHASISSLLQYFVLTRHFDCTDWKRSVHQRQEGVHRRHEPRSSTALFGEAQVVFNGRFVGRHVAQAVGRKGEVRGNMRQLSSWSRNGLDHAPIAVGVEEIVPPKGAHLLWRSSIVRQRTVRPSPRLAISMAFA